MGIIQSLKHKATNGREIDNGNSDNGNRKAPKTSF